MKFVFDLDGTICFDGRTIPAPIREVLLQAPNYGHEVVFASARSYRDCLEVLGHPFSDQLVIGLNGAIAYQNGELVAIGTLDKLGLERILEWSKRHQLPYFLDDRFNFTCYREEKISFYPFVNQEVAEQIALDQVTQPTKLVLYLADHPELVEPLVADLASLECFELSYHDHEGCLYINPKRVNKGSTVKKLVGSEVVAFGNDKNDIPLFQASQFSVQVGDYDQLTPFASARVEDHPAQVAAVISSYFRKFQS